MDRFPPDLGLAVRNDIISWAMQVLEPECQRQRVVMCYVQALNGHLRRHLFTHMPEPIGMLGPDSTVRQAVAELDWHAGRHAKKARFQWP